MNDKPKIQKTVFTIGQLDTPGHSRYNLLAFIGNLPPDVPIDVTIEAHKKDRSAAQNRLAFDWYRQAADQLKDETPDEKRAYCKLCIGIPILRADDEKYKARYDEILKPLDYSQKIALMMEPFSLPVTSLMNVKQFTRYLEAIERHFAQQGVHLTAPDDLRRDAMGLNNIDK